MTQLASCTFSNQWGGWHTGRMVDNPTFTSSYILESIFVIPEDASWLTLSLHDQPVENAIKVEVEFQKADASGASGVSQVMLPEAEDWPSVECSSGPAVWQKCGRGAPSGGPLHKGLYLRCSNADGDYPVRPETKWFTRFRKLSDAYLTEGFHSPLTMRLANGPAPADLAVQSHRHDIECTDRKIPIDALSLRHVSDPMPALTIGLAKH